MPPEKLWKTASSYLCGICHKERDSLQFLSGGKKITSWTNARLCTCQREKWTIVVHWMIRCADFQLSASAPESWPITETEHIHAPAKSYHLKFCCWCPPTEKASEKKSSTRVQSAAETRYLFGSYFKLRMKLEFETEISPRNPYFKWIVFVYSPSNTVRYLLTLAVLFPFLLRQSLSA